MYNFQSFFSIFHFKKWQRMSSFFVTVPTFSLHLRLKSPIKQTVKGRKWFPMELFKSYIFLAMVKNVRHVENYVHSMLFEQSIFSEHIYVQNQKGLNPVVIVYFPTRYLGNMSNNETIAAQYRNSIFSNMIFGKHIKQQLLNTTFCKPYILRNVYKVNGLHHYVDPKKGLKSQISITGEEPDPKLSTKQYFNLVVPKQSHQQTSWHENLRDRPSMNMIASKDISQKLQFQP